MCSWLEEGLVSAKAALIFCQEKGHCDCVTRRGVYIVMCRHDVMIAHEIKSLKLNNIILENDSKCGGGVTKSNETEEYTPPPLTGKNDEEKELSEMVALMNVTTKKEEEEEERADNIDDYVQ